MIDILTDPTNPAGFIMHLLGASFVLVGLIVLMFRVLPGLFTLVSVLIVWSFLAISLTGVLYFVVGPMIPGFFDKQIAQQHTGYYPHVPHEKIQKCQRETKKSANECYRIVMGVK